MANTPATAAAVTIRSRAVDDCGNIEAPSAGISVTVDPAARVPCPLAPAGCSVWNDATLPALVDSGDTHAVALGIKFRPNISGFITGIRFYKSAANTGTHIAHLWTSGGGLLATATFTGETASGWQQVTLPSPVAVTAGTDFVASYHTASGHYSTDIEYFTASIGNGPLTGLVAAKEDKARH